MLPIVVRLLSLAPLWRSSRSVLRLLAWLGLVAASVAAQASVPTPNVSIPAAGTHGFPFLTSSIDLAPFGYAEQEFLISGTAQAFVNSGPLGNDGVWNVSPGATAPYVTRILVRKPVDPARFNGTVVVEWLNVTGGIDTSPDWDYEHVELLREGYAWVGVTAQFVGAAFLPVFDSARYASITHPGDSWSYDIFSQAAMAVLDGNPRPLGNLTHRVRTLLAEGESQSAFRMLTYYNAVQPLAQVYQGILIHSTGTGSPLSQSFAGGGIGVPEIPTPPGVPATPDIAVPPTAFVRGDLRQPVLFFNTETDITVLGAGFSVHNQPDSHTFRMWEIAGTTHADAYLLQFAGQDAAKSGLAVPPFNCGNPPINNGPETFAVRTALRALTRWTQNPERSPPIGPRFSVQIVTSPAPAAVIERDPQTGNAIGGIRLPPLAVPIETLTGIRPPAAVAGNPNCVLFGAADPWDGDTDAWDGVAGLDPSPTPEPSLEVLYGTKLSYLIQYGFAAERSVFEGFLLPEDTREMIELAEAASVPKGAASNASIIPNP
jgi:Alpha/beta hydrolase domain